MKRMSIIKSLWVLCCSLLLTTAWGQEIMRGRVQEDSTKAPMFGVYVENLNSNRAVMTDSFGNFELEVKSGDLVEIQKFTYETIRIRIPKGKLPGFYILDMNLEVEELEEIQFFSYAPQHVRDSLKKTEVYKSFVEFYRKEDLNPLADAFAFMSKRNRQIWAFQAAFDYWEQEKFIDYVFNDELILKVTELNKDALPEFKKHYRPSYEMIKSFRTEYEYYLYVKQAGADYLYHARQHYRR